MKDKRLITSKTIKQSDGGLDAIVNNFLGKIFPLKINIGNFRYLFLW